MVQLQSYEEKKSHVSKYDNGSRKVDTWDDKPFINPTPFLLQHGVHSLFVQTKQHMFIFYPSEVTTAKNIRLTASEWWSDLYKNHVKIDCNTLHAYILCLLQQI